MLRVARTKPFAAGLVLIVALTGASLAVRHFLKSRVSRRPNIVIIVVDALRQDHLPIYGYSRNDAPFLSRLASQAAVFDGISPTSWTKPAVASLLTGLYPVRHQTFGRTDVVPPDLVTLPELLTRAGYTCDGVTSNAWISAENGFDPGFASLEAVQPTGPTSPATAQMVNQSALARLAGSASPFFTYIHYVDTHLPYRPAMAWDGSPIAPRDRLSVGEDELLASSFVSRPPALVHRAVDLYDGAIRQVDAAIEDVFRTLKERGVLENTIVIITADHGEEFEDHGRMGHGHGLYQEVTRIPLLVTGPGITPGRRSGAASLIDIVPTIGDLLDLRLPDRAADGVSLRRNLIDPALRVADRDLLLHLDCTVGARTTSRLIEMIPAASLALIRDGSKLVVSKTPFEKAVFDLRADPAERRNVFADDAHVTSVLASALANAYNDLSRRKERRITMQNATETQRAVAALGYVAGLVVSEPRTIPGRIAAPDTVRDGDLGWALEIDACINLAAREDLPQLLMGWYAPEVDGRWTGASATAVLPISGASGRHLSISGRNGRPGTVQTRIDIGTAAVSERAMLPGPFIWNVPLSGYDGTSNVARISVSSTYRPSDHGSPDDRELGIFISSMCVE